MPPLLEARHLVKHYRPSGLSLLTGARVTKAVEDVSFTIDEGEVYGVVGESGSGKTTVGRLVLGLVKPNSGSIWFNGRDVTTFNRQERHNYHRDVQLIFQNPFSALNPRRTILDSLSVGYEVYNISSGGEKERKLVTLLEQVGLGPEVLRRYPHQLSGGQRQRIVIARALTVGPRFIVADEPVSALDVSIQAQVLNLLRALQRDLKFTLLLISHDLRIISHLCDRIGVMYLGRMVEESSKADFVARTLHPYSGLLIASAPTLQPDQTTMPLLAGEIWDKAPPPNGCVFMPRCPIARLECATFIPSFEEKRPDHRAACWRVQGDGSTIEHPVQPSIKIESVARTPAKEP